MTDRHARYLADLKARHAAEFGVLERALAGRCPALLRDVKRRHEAVEQETERILRAISREILRPAKNPGGAEFRAQVPRQCVRDASRGPEVMPMKKSPPTAPKRTRA